MKVFLSGAMSGLAYNEYTHWREEATHKLLDHGIKVIDPAKNFNFNMSKSEYSEAEVRDFDLCGIENCDVVLVNLAHDSIGTAIEIFRAQQLHKPVIGYAAHDALHPWMALSVNKFCDTLEEAIDYINFHYGELF